MSLNVPVGRVASALMILAIGAASASPVPQATPEPQRRPATGASRDIFDVLRQLRHRPPKAEPEDPRSS